MTDLLAPRPGNGHLNEDQRDRAMLVLALEGGQSERAHERLTGEGLDISARQLRFYRDTERYKQIREQKAPEIERNLLGHYQDAARLSAELQLRATEQTLAAVNAGDIKPADVGKIAQQAAVASGIALDKAFLIEGRPTTITGHEDLPNAIARMQRRLGIESTAEDITDASLLPESALSNAGQ